MADRTRSALPLFPSSVTPAPVSHPGVNAAAASPLAPGAAAASNSDSREGDRQAVVEASTPDLKSSATATNSNPTCTTPELPPSVSANCGDVSASSFSSFGDPGMAGFDIDFEREIATLEAQWLRDGIIMNATTFFTEAANSISPASNSSA